MSASKPRVPKVWVSSAAAYTEGRTLLEPLGTLAVLSAVLLLCARAVGRERVTALLMPEKQGNPEAEKYAHQAASWLGVETITRDLSPILKSLGTYDFILPRIPTRLGRALAVRTFFTQRGKNPFHQLAHGESNEMMRRGFALYNSKQRIRLVVEYLIAEQNNLLVVGSAHKTEDLVGLFVKFGVDDNADLMPLKNFYRTQTLLLAKYLDVPEQIRQRTPNPDLIPGVEDKYVDMLGISAEKIDLILYGLEHGMSDADIAVQIGIEEAKVAEIRSLVQATGHMRAPSQAPDGDAF